MRALRSETLDLEDMRRGMSITDFALDDYRIELERYMNANPGVLEGAATGLHAVVSIPDDLRAQVSPGVVFCLQQRDGTHDANRAHAPLSLIYVPRDATGAPTLSHPTCSLDLLRRLCEGHREPLEALCAQFDRATPSQRRSGREKRQPSNRCSHPERLPREPRQKLTSHW